MTGPEHYRAAEQILSDVDRALEYGLFDELTAHKLAVAQAHATLALTAATALGTTGIGEADMGEWTALICEPDDPYEGMTNADVMSASEIAEYDRDAEFALDAADEERHLAEDGASSDDHDH